MWLSKFMGLTIFTRIVLIGNWSKEVICYTIKIVKDVSLDQLMLWVIFHICISLKCLWKVTSYLEFNLILNFHSYYLKTNYHREFSSNYFILRDKRCNITTLHSDITVKCHYNACHYNANASLTRSSLGSQTAPTCPHDHPRVAQHMGYRCEIIAVWSATAAMTPLCSHTNGIKQRYPTCWLCQYSRFMIDLRSNTLIIHLRCSENAINRSIWLPDARMLKTISVAIKST